MLQTDEAPAARIVNAGVDYFTCTARTTKRRKALWELGSSLVAGERDAGNDLRPYSRHGMSGWHSGSATTAEHQDYTLLSISSHLSRQHWREAYSHSTNVSRIDLMACITHDPPVSNWAWQAYVDACLHRQEGRGKGDIDYRETFNQGSTFYVGKRISQRYLRGYDKFHESKLDEYRGCWQVEDELKDKAANMAAEKLNEYDRDGAAIVGYIAERLIKLGVRRGPTLGACPPIVVRRPATDDARRLKWLAQVVGPTVRGLLARGRKAEVDAALYGSYRELMQLLEPEPKGKHRRE